MQHVRHEYADLFEGPQGTAMILLMWQDNLTGVARFFDACLDSGMYQCLLARTWGPGICSALTWLEQKVKIHPSPQHQVFWQR